jgi:hypothetical protein
MLRRTIQMHLLLGAVAAGEVTRRKTIGDVMNEVRDAGKIDSASDGNTLQCTKLTPVPRHFFSNYADQQNIDT